MSSKRVTYTDIVEFYRNKPENPECTQAYISKGYGQKRGGYLAVACAFNSDKVLESDDYYFKVFLTKERIIQLQTFRNFSKDEAENLIRSVCNNQCLMPSQKWHLYVSYIAYQEMAFRKNDVWKPRVKGVKDFTETKFEYYNKCSCPELMLWMIETSGICDQKVKEAFEKAEKLCKSGVNGNVICKEIRDNIVSWDDICIKITEAQK